MEHRPPNATSSWIDHLEEELSAAQTSCLEIILMGDINIDLHISSNNKWLHLIQLFDLTQLVTDFIRITSSTATIIDHIFSSNPENIVECFVPSYAISDHFQVCITRKMNHIKQSICPHPIDVLDISTKHHFCTVWVLI